MRLLPTLSLTLLTSSLLAAGGCTVVHNGPVAVTCDLPAFDNAQSTYPIYHVSANQVADIPAGGYGFSVSSNGAGDYRLSWSDQGGAATCFTGLVTGNAAGSLTHVAGLTGHEATQVRRSGQQIAFASIPGASYDGVDFHSDRDPTYVDMYANGVGAFLYYVDGVTRFTSESTSNLAALYSP